MSQRSLFGTWNAEDWAKVSVLVLFVTWVPSMLASLWLDELGSYWTISGSLSETISRATEFQGQSPFAYVLMWGWKELLSPGDFGLRLLPVLFGLGTLVGLYSIAKRVAGSSAAWFAVAASVSSYDFRLLVVNLRPYAFALFFLAWSTRLLLAWEDRFTWPVAAGYVVASAAALWSVYYSVFGLIAHVFYVVARRDEGDGRSLFRFSGMVGAVGLLCLPLIPQLLSLRDRADSLQYTGLPPFRFVVDGLLPAGMSGVWLIVVVATGLPSLERVRKSDRSLAVWLLLVPSVLLYAVAKFSDLGLWVPRYRSASLVGFGLVAAIWIAGYETDRKRARAVIVMVIAGLLVSPPAQFQSEDWRAALSYADEAIGPDQLVVLNSGFVEGASFALLADPTRSELLSAPVSRYPVRQEILLSPVLPAEAAFPYLARFIEGSKYREVAVVSRIASPPSFDSFDLVMYELGYEPVAEKVFRGVEIFVYQRR